VNMPFSTAKLRSSSEYINNFYGINKNTNITDFRQLH
jgi:hypothetical protein